MLCVHDLCFRLLDACLLLLIISRPRPSFVSLFIHFSLLSATYMFYTHDSLGKRSYFIPVFSSFPGLFYELLTNPKELLLLSYFFSNRV